MYLLKIAILLATVSFFEAVPCCCEGPCSLKEIERITKYIKVPPTDAPFSWEEADRARLQVVEHMKLHGDDVADDDAFSSYEIMASEPELKKSNGHLCDAGWELFDESCYYIERQEKLSLDQAEQACVKKGASLFVPNSKQEFETVLLDAPVNFFTWIGLYKTKVQDEPNWHSGDALNINEINWIVNTEDGNNGWSAVSQCAAHFTLHANLGKFSYWYPCSSAFYYICERNASLILPPQAKFFV